MIPSFFFLFVIDIIEVKKIFPLYRSFLHVHFYTSFFFCQEMISEEIIDETDQYEDNHSKRRVHRQTTASVLGGCVIFF